MQSQRNHKLIKPKLTKKELIYTTFLGLFKKTTAVHNQSFLLKPNNTTLLWLYIIMPEMKMAFP